jgi:hypothetical protein
MWVLTRRWWVISALMLAPGVVMLVAGIVDPGARTGDNMSLKTFGMIWILLQLVMNGVLFGYLNRQKKRALYFSRNGIRATATILSADTTGTTINDMPQIELRLEIAPADRMPYTLTDKRCWNPLALAGLQKGAKLPVLIDPRHPKKIMFCEEEKP